LAPANGEVMSSRADEARQYRPYAARRKWHLHFRHARKELLLHFLHARDPWRAKKTPHFCGVLLRS
jgi:hypothetical protein